ncbi:hypothetical protein EYF80_017351 [Liparis tanakae]|uniref:Uncharacterized protein n=1 Tax=Liparis tanakae TaxID=230148 RepID=A0A4Z2I4P5_9TELE|nr:hypothetical protein EYF80_017351 [Liparis tanakae]
MVEQNKPFIVHWSASPYIVSPSLVMAVPCSNEAIRPSTQSFTAAGLLDCLDNHLIKTVENEVRIEFSRKKHRMKKSRLRLQTLTVSHLAFIFSFSNLANSRLSWMIISSFQMSSRAKPMRTMPATTPATMGMMSGPAGQSEINTFHTLVHVGLGFLLTQRFDHVDLLLRVVVDGMSVPLSLRQVLSMSSVATSLLLHSHCLPTRPSLHLRRRERL